MNIKNEISKQSDQEEKRMKKSKRINIIENDKLAHLITKYLSDTKISKKQFADEVEISYHSFISYITKTSRFQNNAIEKILLYFEVENINQLETKINDKIEGYKKQQENKIENDTIVLLLKKYIKGINITKKEMANRLGITQSAFGFYLSKKCKIQDYVIQDIYKYFKINNLNELEEKINIMIEEYKEKNKEELSNNQIIELLICYISETRIEQNTLARKMGINKDTFANYILERNNISNISKKKILKYFDVETTKELREKIEKEIVDSTNIYNLSDDELIILLKKYVNNKGISQRQLSFKIGINECVFNQNLRKIKKFKKENINKILDYFDVKTMIELEEKINEIIKKDIEEKNNIDKIDLEEKNLNDDDENILDIQNTKDCEKESTNDTKIIKENEKINVEQSLQIDHKNDVLKLVNIDVLYSLLDDLLKNDMISKEDYIISWLLFGRNNGIYYSKEKISEFLEIEIDYISKIYINCLIMYRNYFSDSLDNISKLKLTNKDN